MENARKTFNVLFEKNLISYNTIVSAYAKSLNSEESFELFIEIEDTGTQVDAFTFASLLSGASSIGAIEAAFQVFNGMGDHNVISWTSMVTGFAKHGFAVRALETFHKMLEAGVRPNEITYIAVLSACSHVGLISEGWKHFKSMSMEHGIVPRMEHYACMVDLLGRSGCLEEAMEFINLMPFKADALVLRTFLGACRVNGNINLGKHAAKMILEQDPNDTAAYILLSNLYASTGQWDEVAETRKNMKERNLTKEAGCSWIEVENKVHKFYVADTSHPQVLEIYDELDQLALKIKELGYVPSTDFVLHDVEEEQKEQYLFQHSEKIAVAFGFISTSKSKPVRVFKNLRVCGDCHTAFKYFSIVKGREIVDGGCDQVSGRKYSDCFYAQVRAEAMIKHDDRLAPYVPKKSRGHGQRIDKKPHSHSSLFLHVKSSGSKSENENKKRVSGKRCFQSGSSNEDEQKKKKLLKRPRPDRINFVNFCLKTPTDMLEEWWHKIQAKGGIDVKLIRDFSFLAEDEKRKLKEPKEKIPVTLMEPCGSKSKCG
ncbi:hypothetical protein GH714_009469 [Hevea brasiliensis]|uniref:DYW domain-containing protein n=1 Tax=Hevea brasiliensis TaxID=3981 RepID=A0A6A6LX29_HEVBR|nr:hypothetical protein GH714_009469 [Hevea brasiliensis]